ncbi:LPS translocon maturation chaperone LptM [Paraburkholderia tagetis]|uniref:Lipoprotein n=1 Tax=Paraburkholderia tagetis TaxID=2913261 RepID=A0A9X1RSA3_9BURK|nr:lipoprotein [Paraburkholderia tagetis]MCG5076425.1 lipoprotein [Paraburkholderia tagetis]
MRVNFRMRAPASRVSTPGVQAIRVSTPGKILAAFAIGAVAALSLAGCGQKGPLYMPTVPPLPQKPNFETQPQDNAKPTPESALPASGVQDGELPDTSGTPLSLSPDTELKSAPAAADGAQPASATAPAQ